MENVGVSPTEQIYLPAPSELAQLCQLSEVGKLLPEAMYIHVSALSALSPLLQSYESRARLATPQVEGATIIKFSIASPKISYLFYPDFDTDPHPALQASIQVDVQTLSTISRDYSNSDNPPILHRKETFVTRDYPLYEEFAELTRTEEALGLLDNSSAIGTRFGWLLRLKQKGVTLIGNRIIGQQPQGWKPQISRHKAALVRNDFSRPVRLALEAGLFSSETTFFDYGCGYGGDVKRIAEKGYSSAGWDPYYSSDTEIAPADIVNIGYVINVIEDLNERREALLKAWELASKVLLVAAQVLINDLSKGIVAYGDGIITSRNTFQKYYEQEELKSYIDEVLGVDAIPVALGVYFVFRDETSAQSFRASRFRSRATTPRVRHDIKKFEDYQELLTPLMAFVTERGRLPVKGELPQESELTAEFGNFRRAFQTILHATDALEWEAIAKKRRSDLLLYIALEQLNRELRPKDLAPEIREDIKALFGTYKQAYYLADEVLFSLGDRELIAERCRNSLVGKKMPNSLSVHVWAIPALDPLLRLYEGCASRTIGRLEFANVVKFHIGKPLITYLFYPDFDTEPHPVLETRMQIDLRDLHVSYRDYYDSDNPPILHRKDEVVTPDYPLYEKFARLSRQESDWGLLDDFNAISHRQGWLKCLEEHCATIEGHQLFWRQDADPYKLKALRAAVNTRRRNRRHSSGSLGVEGRL